MNYTVTLPSGARFTMLPPGVSEGAEMNPDCARVARRSGHEFGHGMGFKSRETPESDLRKHKAKEQRQRYKRMRSFVMPSGKTFHPLEVRDGLY